MKKYFFTSILLLSSLVAVADYTFTTPKIYTDCSKNGQVVSNTVEPAHWMAYLPDTIKLFQLTIPGLHEATTWSYDDGSLSSKVQDQGMDYNAAWNMGARAFDLRLGFECNAFMHGEDFNDQCRFHHGDDMMADILGIGPMNRFDDDIPNHFPDPAALDGECMILILSEEFRCCEPGKVPGDECEYLEDWITIIEYFMSQLINKYGTDRFVAYHDGITLGEVRGKILLVARDDDFTQYILKQGTDYYSCPINRLSGMSNSWDIDTCINHQQKIKVFDQKQLVDSGLAYTQDIYKLGSSDDETCDIDHKLDAVMAMAKKDNPNGVFMINGYNGYCTTSVFGIELPDNEWDVSIYINSSMTDSLNDGLVNAYGIQLCDFYGVYIYSEYFFHGDVLAEAMVLNNFRKFQTRTSDSNDARLTLNSSVCDNSNVYTYPVGEIPVIMMAYESDGYHFSRWSDGVTDNPRVVTISGDASFTAEYELNSFSISPDSTKNGQTINFIDPFHELVDLGLPSGLAWANCSVGVSTSTGTEYGFAWGYTTPGDHTWADYKWCNGDDHQLTKYNTNPEYGVVDNKTTLDPEDDAATVNWGETWRMPTADEVSELITHCSFIPMSGGYYVYGPNGDSITIADQFYTSTLAENPSAAIILDIANISYIVDVYLNSVDRYHSTFVFPVANANRVALSTSIGGKPNVAYYPYKTAITFSAENQDEHQFIMWSDSVTDNTRTITSDTANLSLTAIYSDTAKVSSHIYIASLDSVEAVTVSITADSTLSFPMRRTYATYHNLPIYEGTIESLPWVWNVRLQSDGESNGLLLVDEPITIDSIQEKMYYLSSSAQWIDYTQDSTRLVNIFISSKDSIDSLVVIYENDSVQSYLKPINHSRNFHNIPAYEFVLGPLEWIQEIRVISDGESSGRVVLDSIVSVLSLDDKICLSDTTLWVDYFPDDPNIVNLYVVCPDSIKNLIVVPENDTAQSYQNSLISYTTYNDIPVYGFKTKPLSWIQEIRIISDGECDGRVLLDSVISAASLNNKMCLSDTVLWVDYLCKNQVTITLRNNDSVHHYTDFYQLNVTTNDGFIVITPIDYDTTITCFGAPIKDYIVTGVDTILEMSIQGKKDGKPCEVNMISAPTALEDLRYKMFELKDMDWTEPCNHDREWAVIYMASDVKIESLDYTLDHVGDYITMYETPYYYQGTPIYYGAGNMPSAIQHLDAIGPYSSRITLVDELTSLASLDSMTYLSDSIGWMRFHYDDILTDSLHLYVANEDGITDLRVTMDEGWSQRFSLEKHFDFTFRGFPIYETNIKSTSTVLNMDVFKNSDMNNPMTRVILSEPTSVDSLSEKLCAPDSIDWGEYDYDYLQDVYFPKLANESMETLLFYNSVLRSNNDVASHGLQFFSPSYRFEPWGDDRYVARDVPLPHRKSPVAITNRQETKHNLCEAHVYYMPDYYNDADNHAWIIIPDLSDSVVVRSKECENGLTIFMRGLLENNYFSHSIDGLTVGNFGTLCYPFAIYNPVGAELYSIAAKKVDSLGQISSLVLRPIAATDTLRAGIPYIFKATNTRMSISYTGVATGTSGSENGLIGNLYNPYTIDDDDDNYVLQQNEVRRVESNNVKVGKNKAYIHGADVPLYNSSHANEMYIEIPVNGSIATNLGKDKVDQESVVKIFRDGHLFILRNGKMYNSHGALVGEETEKK